MAICAAYVATAFAAFFNYAAAPSYTLPLTGAVLLSSLALGLFAWCFRSLRTSGKIIATVGVIAALWIWLDAFDRVVLR